MSTGCRGPPVLVPDSAGPWEMRLGKDTPLGGLLKDPSMGEDGRLTL